MSEVLIPQQNIGGITVVDGVPDYAGVLQDAWGVVTPFHKRTLGILNRVTKEQLTMARLYVDKHPKMTKAQFEELPVHAITKKFLSLWSNPEKSKPYILMLVSDISYAHSEKAQILSLQEDDSVVLTTGSNPITATINFVTYNTPLDPWLTYMESLWNDIFRAGKLAKFRMSMRLHFFDKAMLIIPLQLSVGVRNGAQDIASMSMTAFVRKVIPFLPTKDTGNPPQQYTQPPYTGDTISERAERSAIAQELINASVGRNYTTAQSALE